MGEVLRVLKERGGSIRDFPIAPVRLAALLRLVREGKITGSAAKSIFATMLSTGDAAEAIVEREGLAQISDQSSLEKIVDDVIRENASQVETYRSGKSQVFGYLMGQVMKASRGKANPQVATRLLEERLKSGNPA
jgi:aspartyl-tRNA(Asn)/glutamyl-tRNA(Gln) amidotransferase subunit B